MPGFAVWSEPNSSASSSGSLIALQLMRTNDAGRRGDISWMRSANRSLPTPVSPTINTASLPIAIRAADCSRAASWLAFAAISRRDPARFWTITVTAPTRKGTPIVNFVGELGASFVLSTVVPFELPTSSILTSGPSSKFAWWRDTEPESITTSHLLARPIVSVPAPGSGTTCSAAPSITSNTRSPNGASRSICSVVAPVSSSVTWLGYATPGVNGNSPGILVPCRRGIAAGCGGVEAAPGDLERDPARDVGEDRSDGTGVAGDVDQPEALADGLDPSIREEARGHRAAQ